MTADELSQSLEVSKRTIYRDIDALNMAGVPIYTQDGRNGGIYLDEQYRISLTGLGRDEIQSLFVYGTQGPLNDLGLDNAIENALLKLLAALPLRDREAAQRMRQRIHFDPSQWFFQRDVSRWMPLLLQAVFEDHKLWLRYLRIDGTISERVVFPYGLVAKMDVWYVVAMTEDGDMRTFRVSRFQALDVLDERFARLSSFDLIEHWQENARHFETSRPRYIVRLRVVPGNPSTVRYLNEAHGAQIDPPDEDGWTPLTLNLSAMMEARTVIMGLGNRVEIVDPPELRDEIRAWLQHLQDHYGA
jgi:predicted DNA-binding transcriptional regulator YafY